MPPGCVCRKQWGGEWGRRVGRGSDPGLVCEPRPTGPLRHSLAGNAWNVLCIQKHPFPQPSSEAAHAGCSTGWVRARDPGQLWEPSSPSERGLETLTRSHGCSLLPHWAPDGSSPGHTTRPELTTVMLVEDERRRRPPLPLLPPLGPGVPHPPLAATHIFPKVGSDHSSLLLPWLPTPSRIRVPS